MDLDISNNSDHSIVVFNRDTEEGVVLNPNSTDRFEGDHLVIGIPPNERLRIIEQFEFIGELEDLPEAGALLKSIKDGTPQELSVTIFNVDADSIKVTYHDVPNGSSDSMNLSEDDSQDFEVVGYIELAKV